MEVWNAVRLMVKQSRCPEMGLALNCREATIGWHPQSRLCELYAGEIPISQFGDGIGYCKLHHGVTAGWVAPLRTAVINRFNMARVLGKNGFGAIHLPKCLIKCLWRCSATVRSLRAAALAILS